MNGTLLGGSWPSWEGVGHELHDVGVVKGIGEGNHCGLAACKMSGTPVRQLIVAWSVVSRLLA